MGAAGPFVPVLRDGHVRGCPPGAHAGSVSYGPVLNAAAVLLTAYGNVPPERAAQLIGMLLGTGVSPGWVDKASSGCPRCWARRAWTRRCSPRWPGRRRWPPTRPRSTCWTRPRRPGAGREGGRPGGQGRHGSRRGSARADRPHPRRAADLAAGHRLPPQGRRRRRDPGRVRRLRSSPTATPATSTSCPGWRHQQCCAHVIRRCRAVTKLGPGGLQSWAGDIIAILREAHQSVEAARARGDTALDPQILDDLRERYDTACPPGSSTTGCGTGTAGTTPATPRCLAARLKEQVFLFTRDFSVDWTNNVSERGAKAAKRHQAVSGYWHSLATYRWCRIRSYLDSAAAHGVTRQTPRCRLQRPSCEQLVSDSPTTLPRENKADARLSLT